MHAALTVVAVELAGVSVELNGVLALDRLDLRVERGLTVLTGDTGAGKTTTLRVIAGLLEPGSGTVMRAPGVSIGWLCAAAPIVGLDVPPPSFPVLDATPTVVLVDDLTHGMPRRVVPQIIETVWRLAESCAVVATTHRDDLPRLATVHVHLEEGRACSGSRQ